MSFFTVFFTFLSFAQFSRQWSMKDENYSAFFYKDIHCRSVNRMCSINLEYDFNMKSPLILKPDSTEFIYPDVYNPEQIDILQRCHISVACPDSSIIIYSMGGEMSLGIEYTIVTCICNQYFYVPGIKYAVLFQNIGCAKTPKATEKLISDNRNTTNDTIAHIGFELSNSKFITTIKLRHNTQVGVTLWASSVIHPVTQCKQSSTGRPKFRKGKFFKGIPISKVYTISQQRKTFMTIFQDSKIVDRYLSTKGQKYFARSHMVAHSDQFYRHQQSSTYFYSNASPMWQLINNGNWKVIENIVRKFAIENKVDLEVWTGNIGILKLKNRKGNPKAIYLYKDSTEAIPAPLVMFKFIYNRMRNQGLVFITVNNPYLRTLTKSYQICRFYSKCQKMFPRFQNWTVGYTYCCTVPNFFKNRVVSKFGLPSFPNARPLF